MIHELTMKQFIDIVVEKLKELEIEVTLANPTTESKFPCKVVSTPLINIRKQEEVIPIYTRFSISVEEWASKQFQCMEMTQETIEKLREHNICKTSNGIALRDSITNKYRLINNYEVNFNGLTNSFEAIK